MRISHHHICICNLAFSTRLLRCHRKIVRLIHIILIWILFFSINFAIWIFLRFLILNFVSYRWRRLWILNLIKILCYLSCVKIMNIIFAASGYCAPRIWINASNPVIICLSYLSCSFRSLCPINWFTIFFINIYSAFILTSFT